MDEIETHVVGRAKIRDSDHLGFERQQVADQDYSGLKLTSFAAVESSFSRCRFERMRIKDACFGAGIGMSEYVDCSFDGSRIVATAPGQARFVRCSFRDVQLTRWFCTEAEFVDCVFTGKAEKVVFHGTPDAPVVPELGRSKNEFHGNDFSGMDLRDVGFFSGIDLTAQVLPTGADYVLVLDAPAAVVRARDAVRFWEDDPRREKALAFLRFVSGLVDEGQDQVFLRLSDYKRHHDQRTLSELARLLGEPDDFGPPRG